MLTPLDNLFGSMLTPSGYFIYGFGLFDGYHQKDN